MSPPPQAPGGPPPAQSEDELPLLTRLWFAWLCLIRVLFDGSFAARVWALRAAPAALPDKAGEADRLPAARSPAKSFAPAKKQDGETTPEALPGLQLLSLLQREGRFVDFIEQDVTTFSDEEVGAAARIVHEGCRKALHRLTSVEPVRQEDEGAQVMLEAGFPPSEVVLVGNVQGTPPYRGTLRHRGWRATGLSLPEVAPGHDPTVLAPAEVEI